MTAAKRWVGRSVSRVEDDRLLRGRARFIDDIDFPDLLHAAFLRSPIAHARLTLIDKTKAEGLPGVRGIFTFDDLRPLLTGDRIPLALPSAAIRFDVDPYCLVRRELTYVGEPIAVVVAESRALAEDAVNAIDIAFEPLPVVTDPYLGLQESARARLDCPDNLVARQLLSYGDVDRAFAQAAVRIEGRFRLHKGGGHSIETRGVVARFDTMTDMLTVWDSTQMPHRSRAVLVAALGMAESRIRVIAPDVGGGFGPKAPFHPEELVVPAAALLLKAPVKWIEDRLESFTATVQERDQIWQVEAAAADDGKLLAIRGKLYHDHGAYTPYGIALPYNAATNLIGPYVLPAYELEISLCLTNMVPVAPTRGAGRPQGTFVMEQLLDRIASALGLARDEIRRRNFIAPQRMPYEIPVTQRDGSRMTYDSGDYPECQRRALAAADWTGFRQRQEEARRRGRWIGIGLANYVEATGRGPFESVTIRIGPSGQIFVATGATAQGQGTATMLAQLAAEVLGVAPDEIQVRAGDTDGTLRGLGAFASRQAVTAGNAVHRAASALAAKARQAAAAMMEVAPDDLELKDGSVRVKGVPEMRRSLAEIATALAGVPGYALPANLSPGLDATVEFAPSGLTYTNGTHVVEAEVDIATGNVRLDRYIVVHDCGNIINPRLVEGQVYGAVVHGIGMTLFEWMRFDPAGQPLSVTYADYLLPSSDVVPRVEIHHMETPTPLNPLGVKGAAESGTIAAPAAIVSAIEDALRPLGVRVEELPIVPPRLFALIKAAQSRISPQ